MWYRKILSILVTVVTLGLIQPTDFLHSQEVKQEVSLPVDSSTVDVDIKLPQEIEDSAQDPDSHGGSTWQDHSFSIIDQEELTKQFKVFMLRQADVQVERKFGPTISARVGEEYRQVILPEFEKAIVEITKEADEEWLRHVEITNRPASGQGEKIFHLFDTRTGKDVVRYHVRREKPPQDGYWFSFHYHKEADQFEGHHELGKIYWDKNTPPRWVS